MKNPKVIVAGKYNVDTFYYMDDVKVGYNNVAKQIKVELGGKAGNVAIGLRKLGVEVVATGCIGKDGFGNFIKRKLEEYGVDISHLKECKAPTGRTAIAVDKNGENTMLNYPGANLKFSPDMIDWTLLDNGKALFIQFGLPIDTIFELASMAKRAGMTVFVDPSFPSEIPWDAFSYFDYFSPNEREAIDISGKKDVDSAAKFFLKKDVEVVVLKRGKEGVKIYGLKKSIQIPSINVKVVDTTGAGDAFNCGFLYGRLKGFTDEESAKLGVAAASIAVSRKGSSSSLPTLDELKDFIKEKGIKLKI